MPKRIHQRFVSNCLWAFHLKIISFLMVVWNRLNIFISLCVEILYMAISLEYNYSLVFIFQLHPCICDVFSCIYFMDVLLIGLMDCEVLIMPKPLFISVLSFMVFMNAKHLFSCVSFSIRTS